MLRKFLFTVLMVSTFGLATTNAEYWCQVSRVATCDNYRTSVPLHGVYDAREANRSCHRYARSINQYMCQVRFIGNSPSSNEGYYCQLSRGVNCLNNRYSFPTYTFDVAEAGRICSRTARSRGEIMCQLGLPR